MTGMAAVHALAVRREIAAVRPPSVPAEAWLTMGEAQRLAVMRAHAQVPDDVGPVPAAPARGAFRVTDLMVLMPQGADGFHRVPGGHRGRRTVVAADVFDRMEEDARRAHARAGGKGVFVPPLTAGQVLAGRDYRDRVERYMAAGMRCASLETMVDRGPGGGGEWIDAVVADGRRIAAVRARVGSGVAMAIRRVRPSQRGASARGLIPTMALIDLVCVGDRNLSDVLDVYGWSVDGEHRNKLKLALAEALERMRW